MDRSGFENSPKETLVGGQTSMQDDMVKLYCHNKHTELTKKVAIWEAELSQNKYIQLLQYITFIYTYYIYIYQKTP